MMTMTKSVLGLVPNRNKVHRPVCVFGPAVLWGFVRHFYVLFVASCHVMLINTKLKNHTHCFRQGDAVAPKLKYLSSCIL